MLANAVTTLLHGAEAAAAAEATAREVFEKGGIGEDLPTVTLAAEELAEGVGIVQLFVRAGLAASGKDAKRLIAEGGAKVNDDIITDSGLALWRQASGRADEADGRQEAPRAGGLGLRNRRMGSIAHPAFALRLNRDLGHHVRRGWAARPWRWHRPRPCPTTTWPTTVYWPSRNSPGANMMKNWLIGRIRILRPRHADDTALERAHPRIRPAGRAYRTRPCPPSTDRRRPCRTAHRRSAP